MAITDCRRHRVQGVVPSDRVKTMFSPRRRAAEAVQHDTSISEVFE